MAWKIETADNGKGGTVKVGDKVQLVRRHSNLNGWSIREDLNGKIATIIEIEDRENGFITVTYNGQRLGIFRDAVGQVFSDTN